MATYSEKLRDPRWQKMRLLVMDRDEFKCQECKRTDKTLNVHHKKYTYGRDPWDYEMSNFITLCEKCHEKEHPELEAKDQQTIIASAEQRVIWKLVDREEPPIMQALDMQIKQLQDGLKRPKDDHTTEEVLRNILFLQAKKKELLIQ